MRKIIATLAIALALAVPAAGQIVNGQGGVVVNGVLNAVMATSGTFGGLTISSANSTGLTDLLINPAVKTSGNLIDAQVGGVSKFNVTYVGNINATGFNALPSFKLGFSDGLLSLGSTATITFSSTEPFYDTKDLGLARASAGVLKITDGSTGYGAITTSQYRLSALNTAPASAAATGTLGEVRVTADSIYVCIATDTWVKAALATW